ncbi:hypothetical protein B0H19DRAFT_1375348 [Mycena capillaripes]|nr:hypothetical protein B0H19DRAFT_1375348 [Mycena capillaripes]
MCWRFCCVGIFKAANYLTKEEAEMKIERTMDNGLALPAVKSQLVKYEMVTGLPAPELTVILSGEWELAEDADLHFAADEVTMVDKPSKAASPTSSTKDRSGAFIQNSVADSAVKAVGLPAPQPAVVLMAEWEVNHG